MFIKKLDAIKIILKNIYGNQAFSSKQGWVSRGIAYCGFQISKFII
jgi:hypothetical protein